MTREIKITRCPPGAAAWRQGPPPSVRVADIRRWLHHLYGFTLPNNDAGRDAAFVMCCHLARCPDAPKRIRNWLSLLAPWMPPSEREALLARVIARPFRWSADVLAHVLGGVTDDDRQRFSLGTIGAVDVPKAEREARRRERKRERDTARRRGRGAKPRAVYEANSVNRAKPWLALGISRATWFRRREKERETSPRPAYFEACMVDAHLSQPSKPSRRGLSDQGTVTIAEDYVMGRSFQVEFTRSW
jgi:hypothetical protein